MRGSRKQILPLKQGSFRNPPQISFGMTHMKLSPVPRGSVAQIEGSGQLKLGGHNVASSGLTVEGRGRAGWCAHPGGGSFAGECGWLRNGTQIPRQAPFGQVFTSKYLQIRLLPHSARPGRPQDGNLPPRAVGRLFGSRALEQFYSLCG
jgi:hypothetical protein